MPCYDERNSPSYVRGETIGECMREFTHNSPVAEMLCSTLKTLTTAQIDALPTSVQRWWVEHKKRDSDKLEREKAAVQAAVNIFDEELRKAKAKLEKLNRK